MQGGIIGSIEGACCFFSFIGNVASFPYIYQNSIDHLQLGFIFLIKSFLAHLLLFFQLINHQADFRQITVHNVMNLLYFLLLWVGLVGGFPTFISVF